MKFNDHQFKRSVNLQTVCLDFAFTPLDMQKDNYFFSYTSVIRWYMGNLLEWGFASLLILNLLSLDPPN